MEQQLSSLLRTESNKVSLFLTIMLFRYFQAHIILVIFYILSSSPLILALTDLGSNATDRRALLSFKSLVTSAQDVLVSWNDSSGICNWYGVGCDDPRHADRVTSLKLGTLSLSGTMSPSLANLTFLRYLNLSSNKLHGVIPEDLGRLRWLKHLELGDNLLEGEIPETLSHCTDLLTFALAGNNLSGSIPANLSRLSNLQNLLLQGNRLTGDIPPGLGLLPMLLDLSLRDNNLTGSIPPSLGNISTLTYLHLSFNNLEGTIPPELSKIKRMLIFDVGFNGLSGTIPPVMFNFSSLYTFAVERNLLTGRLPSDLGQSLPSLEILFLYNNHFEGPIPLSLANCTNFQKIELDNNSFSGIVPPIFGRMQNLYKILLGSNNFVATGEEDWSFMDSLTNCSSLEHIDLSENNFSGVLPHSIINLPPSLGWLRLRDNQIMGEIPLGIGDLSGLVTLNFDNNRLTGSISSTIGKLRNLTAFTLTSNNLAGVIPDSICNLIQMLELHMSGNGFSGSIPSCFPSMQKLIVLDLSHNNLSGIIPKGLLAISSIVSFLNISNNFLTGVLPEEVGSLANLQILDVSNNKFFGTIPRSLGKCVLLEYLYLECNDFNGSIPEDLKNLRGVQLLDMSRNHLSGSIPTFLEDMTALQYLNLSFNDLEGEVPTEGLFSNLSRFSIEGNNKLCGGDYKLRMKSCSRYGDGGDRKISKPVLAGIISIAALVSLSMCCFLFYKFSPKKYDRKPTFYREYSWMDNQFLKISYTDIQKATNNFSPGNLIGSGGFGNVYKGVITMGKKIEIAVKVLNEQVRATSKSFIAECTVLRNVRHRNLVRLLTACSSIDPQGNEFMALVYELMPNGSLEKWLHEYESSCALNFLQRLNIAIDVASALDYLHNQTEITIVHRDLKPSNVLLDSDMVAHVSDFGISKLISSDLDQTITTAVQGSIGYTAPECGMGSRLSALWDVYSYGILLLEMFTGKSPTDEAFSDGMTLHKYVEVRFPNEIMSIVDPRLLEQEKYDRTSKNSIYDAMVSIVRIGLICSNDAPNERMQMDGVIRRLDDIKDTLLREDTVMQLKGSYESKSLLEKWN